MQVRVKLQILSPTVKHGEEANFSSHVLGIGGNDLQRFRGRPEKDGIDRLFVLVGDPSNLSRNREHDMIIGAVEQLGLTVFNPLRSR